MGPMPLCLTPLTLRSRNPNFSKVGFHVQGVYKLGSGAETVLYSCVVPPGFGVGNLIIS